MSSKKYFFILIGVLVLINGLIIGGAIGGNIVLQKQAAKLAKLKVENKAIEAQQSALVQAKKDVEKYGELEKITKSVVPQDKDQAKTVREIVQIAGANSIPIKTISFDASTLGATIPKAAPPAEGTPAAKLPTTTVSQVKPIEGIPGVYTLEIQVASAGEVSYQNFLKFLESLEKNRRTAHVSAISLDPNDEGNRLNFNLTLNAYVKP
jgi:hypothetical protein